MKFRDIEIDGKLNEFVSKMKGLGYTFIENYKNTAIMEGNFIGKECRIFILSTPKTKTVWKVAVFLPKESSWRSLKSEYNSVKEQITQKYGKPTKSFNFFSSPYYEGDGYELQAIKNEKCTYYSYWNSENGAITLKISTDCEIIIGYEDDTNSELDDTESNEKIQGDL